VPINERLPATGIQQREVEGLLALHRERWVLAVNADRTYGRWMYRIAKRTTDVTDTTAGAADALASATAAPY